MFRVSERAFLSRSLLSFYSGGDSIVAIATPEQRNGHSVAQLVTARDWPLRTTPSLRFHFQVVLQQITLNALTGGVSLKSYWRHLTLVYSTGHDERASVLIAQHGTVSE